MKYLKKYEEKSYEYIDVSELIDCLDALKKVNEKISRQELFAWFNENDINYHTMSDLDMYIYYIQANNVPKNIKYEDINNEQKSNWKIFAGLGGGFGGASELEILENVTREEAESYAYQLAIDEYESYAGSNGLRDIDEIMEEDGVDENEAEQTYNEERESWLDYWVEEIK